MTVFTRARRLASKAAKLTPVLVSNPRLIPLLRQGIHPEHYARLSAKWLQGLNPGTVIDVGANIGQFTGAAHALFPKADIYAFEPQHDCYETMVKRFANNPRIFPILSAVGDEDGETTFHQNAFSQSSSVLEMTDLHRESFSWATERATVQVPIQRLDNIAAELTLESPMLIKIDVQGFEDRVLRGGERTIRAADVVLVETSFEPLYEGEANFATVYELMTGYGFRYAGNIDQIANPANDRPLYADALFLQDR